jgi:hypothetical protein
LVAFGVFVVDFNDLASIPSAEAQYGTSRRVARRTSRRTANRQMAMAGGGGTTYVTALPSGCSPAGAYYNCGNTQYQQAMQGDSVVYVPVEPE